MKNGGTIGPKNSIQPYRTSGIYNLSNQYTANKSGVWEKQIIKNGLVFWLDSDNPNSYPGSGNTWFDISGNSLNATGSSPIVNRILRDTQPYTTGSTSILDDDTHSLFFLLQINAVSGGWSKIFGYTPSGSDRSPGIWRRPNERILHWRYDPGNSGSDLSRTSVDDISAEFLPNRWYYVGVTKNGSTATYYVDGNKIGTFTASNPKTAGSSTIQIYPSYNQNTSRMSSVQIYNRVLSDAEVLQNYNAINKRFDKYIIPQLSAFGGAITRSGNYTVHTFTSSGNFIVNSSSAIKSIEYLVVAGGGGGGAWVGGGGGAGGFLEGSFTPASESYTITVGAGGIGELNPGGYGGMPRGRNGGNSSISGVATAIGGGRGGSWSPHPPLSGGSGGGAGHSTTAAGTAGQGFSGGVGRASSTNGYPTGGGGGAGGVGGNWSAAKSGNGGPGLPSSITGTQVYYAGGGGGGVHGSSNNAAPGNGGIGGGGDGTGPSTGKAQSGQPNTGGGGGGNGNAGGSRSEGGDGGSGIVVIRYQTE